MISKFLEMQVKEDMAETVALKYMSGVKLLDRQKVKVNMYELGGGRTFANLLEAAIVSPGNPDTTTVCICLDLSQPGNSIENLEFWLKVIKEMTNQAV